MMIVSERPPVLQNQAQNTQVGEAEAIPAGSCRLYGPRGTPTYIKQHLLEQHLSFPKGYYVKIIICINKGKCIL